MATYTLLSDGAVRNLLAGASPECGDFTMKRWMDVFPEHFFSSAGEHTDALIIQASFPMCHAQDLMLDLEAANYCPAIILFTIMPDGSIQYVLSDETVLPLSEQLAAYFMDEMRNLETEHLYLAALDASGRLLYDKAVFKGTINYSVVNPREILRIALQCDAAQIVILHNHPSGNPIPSGEDIKMTKRLYEASDLIGIPLVDHIIIGDNRYISLKERGLI